MGYFFSLLLGFKYQKINQKASLDFGSVPQDLEMKHANMVTQVSGLNTTC